jgi:hypothetical protein
MNARVPSFISSVAVRSAHRLDSSSNPCWRERFLAPLITLFPAATPRGPFSMILAESSKAISIAWPGGTTFSTNPSLNASVAPMASPVKTSSFSLPREIWCKERQIPPFPGKTDRFTSGKPNLAVSSAHRISQQSASSNPPAQAKTMDRSNHRPLKVFNQCVNLVTP